ncbi:DUF4411 family protein [Proteus mirabilis]
MDGQLISIRNVFDELQKQDDEICTWSKGIMHCFQSVDDQETQMNFRAIANYVQQEYAQDIKIAYHTFKNSYQ